MQTAAAATVALFTPLLGWAVLALDVALPRAPAVTVGPGGLSALVPSAPTPTRSAAVSAPTVPVARTARAAAVTTRSARTPPAHDAARRAAARAAFAASPRALADAPTPSVRALVQARSIDALGEHAQLLSDAHRPEGVRAAAATALGTSTTRRALELLVAATSDPDPLARRLAARALTSRPSSPEACAALVRLLGDGDAVVRLAAAGSLVAFAQEGAAALRRRLEVEDHLQVQLACLDALGRVGGPADEPTLAAWSQRPGLLGERAAQAHLAVRRRGDERR